MHATQRPPAPRFRNVRVATADDIPALVRVINRAYVAESEIVHGVRTNPGDIERRMSASNCWFLVIDAELPGGATTLAGSVMIDCDGKRGHIGLLSVDPDFQKCGLGVRLLRAAEEHCHSAMHCPVVELEVVSARTDLFGFYDRMGYVATGTAPFPAAELLKQPAHMVIMRKRAAGDSGLGSDTTF